MDTTVINVNTNLYRQVADYARNHNTSVEKMMESLIVAFLADKPKIEKPRRPTEYSLTEEQKRKLALVEKCKGAFATSQKTDWKKDIEDALQYFSAELSNADYIVTRNPKDFSFATTVQIKEPKDFINAYFPNEV